MLAILRDFRYAFWTLRRAPGFALLCMGVLALGIGANAAIFSVLDAVILKALPYPDADRLVFVWERFPNMPPPFGPRMPVVHRNYVVWQRQNTVFSEMAAFRATEVQAKGAAGPGKLSVGFANVGYSHAARHARGRHNGAPGGLERPAQRYSARSANIGSIREARRAGR